MLFYTQHFRCKQTKHFGYFFYLVSDMYYARLHKTCRTGFVEFNSPSQHKTHHIVNSTLNFQFEI